MSTRFADIYSLVHLYLVNSLSLSLQGGCGLLPSTGSPCIAELSSSIIRGTSSLTILTVFSCILLEVTSVTIHSFCHWKGFAHGIITSSLRISGSYTLCFTSSTGFDWLNANGDWRCPECNARHLSPGTPSDSE